MSYLPYGVTTLELNLQGDAEETLGWLYPANRATKKYGFYCGFSDESENFLIIWGGGFEKGLHITKENFNKRLFLQILHCGVITNNDKISIRHNKATGTVKKIKLSPVNVKDPIRMCINEGEYTTITFNGNMMPEYYSRWFPPRPVEGQMISYRPIKAPKIEIKFIGRKNKSFLGVNSDVELLLDGIKIAVIRGDWRYSYFHAEIFSVFETEDYLVIRCWFYWLHKNFSKNILLGFKSDNLGTKTDTDRSLLRSLNIECPDIERFDFLLDVKKRKITYVGTDFHYQELWYELNNIDCVRAAISNDPQTIVQVLEKFKNRINQKNRLNPIDSLRIKLRGNAKEWSTENIPISSPKRNEGKIDTNRRRGLLRKHIPFANNAALVSELVSNVVTS